VKKIFLLLAIFASTISVNAQDLLSGIEPTADVDFSIATFKSTRLINMHTIETTGPRTLDFRISHRFGAVNSGAYNFWGLDGPANIRLGLEYSPDGRFMFGIGRSSLDKSFDGFLKYRLLRQKTDNSMPISLTLLACTYYTSMKDPNKEANGYDKYEYTSSRFSYCYELMFARKFTPSFSLQIAPWFVHYNLVDEITDKNDVYGLSGLLRLKFTKRAAITVEYGYRMNDYTAAKTGSADDPYHNTFAIGYELETGGHVFQIHFTNSFGITEEQFFPKTESEWNDAGIRLGFNISRVFTL
jgi:hypothetical protein